MDDVLIVSAWGRELGLVRQLKEHLLKVKILDMSSLFAPVSCIEREGAFWCICARAFRG